MLRFAWDWVIVVSNCTVGLRRRYRVFHWLFRGFTGNWLKTRSHNAVGPTDPIYSITSKISNIQHLDAYIELLFVFRSQLKRAVVTDTSNGNQISAEYRISQRLGVIS